MIYVKVRLHGFPDLGLSGGTQPQVAFEIQADELSGRAICKALLARFGAPLAPVLSHAENGGRVLKNLHVFVNNIQITDIDERLEGRAGAENRISVLLILVRAIAGG